MSSLIFIFSLKQKKSIEPIFIDRYDYTSYEYGYDPNAAAAAAAAAGYSPYPGYETSTTYSTPTGYDGYAAAGAYHAG